MQMLARVSAAAHSVMHMQSCLLSAARHVHFGLLKQDVPQVLWEVPEVGGKGMMEPEVKGMVVGSALEVVSEGLFG